MKVLDRIVGGIACKVFTHLPLATGSLRRTILFIRPGGIGDAVHLVVIIKVLRQLYPDVVIDVLAEQRNATVFQFCPEIRNIFCYDSLHGLSWAFHLDYDIVIDTEQWHHLSAVVARITRAPMLIGFATSNRKKLFTHPVPYSHDCYEADSFSRLLEPLGIPRLSEMTVPFLEVPVESEKQISERVGKFAGQPFIVIFPGASIPERRWSAQSFKAVAERLYAQGIPIIVVGGRDNISDGETIIGGIFGLNLAGKTSLTETAAIIEKAAVLLSGDSGILHIGVGLGKPTVSLFGPGIEKKWAPRGENHIVINKHPPCSPCTKFGYTPKCPINAKCMSDITVDEVFDAVMRLLAKSGNIPGNGK